MSIGIQEDFSQYMNNPECPLIVGDLYYRVDSFPPEEEPYLVKGIVERDNKFYGVCEHRDAFTDEIAIEEVYCFYLSKEK